MKKVLMYFSIAIGIVFFACVCFAVALVLMPGKRIFGIKYIAAEVGNYKQKIVKSFTTQDIYIYAHDVPLNILFGETGTVGIEYVQEYQGYTLAKDTPSVEFKNKNGEEFNDNQDTDAVYIYVNQYKKFIWSNGNGQFYLNLNLPIAYKGNGSIFIETSNSKVTFSGMVKSVKNLTVKTQNKVEIKNKLTVENLNIKTNVALELGKNVQVAPLTASGTSQVNVEIPNENLTIVNAVNNGDINFTTAGGNLTFNTCRNLTVNSGSGSINQPTSKFISGNLTFNTTSGSVTIDNVKGTNNKINSTSSKIQIGFCAGDLNVITNRSNVTLGTVSNVSVSTTTGDISVTYITGKIVASSTRSGDILCGKVLNDATLTTKNGDITVTGAVGGNLSMNSQSGNLQMLSCNNLIAKTEEGSLSGYNGGKVVVNGTANINCTKGGLTISKILGTNNDDSVTDNVIITKNGQINIGTIIGSTKIESYNSPIAIAATGEITITTKYSPISILSAPYGATISNISGDIIVGSADNSSLTTGDISIKSSEGTIDVYNTTGNVYLFSNQTINFVNQSSTKIYINTTTGGDTTGKGTGRGKVAASKLKGEVRVCSQNDIVLTFAEVSNNIRVDSSGASAKVVIDASCIAAKNVNYIVQSSKGVVNDVFVGQTKQQNARFSVTNNTAYPTIKVYTTYAKTTLKLA